jgi:hypothetical protein
MCCDEIGSMEEAGYKWDAWRDVCRAPQAGPYA